MILWAGVSSWSKRVERCRGKAEREALVKAVLDTSSPFCSGFRWCRLLASPQRLPSFQIPVVEGMVQEPRVGVVLLEKLKYIKIISTLQAFMATSLLVALAVSSDSILGSRNGLPWSFDISLRKFQLLQIVNFPMGKWLIRQLQTSFMLELS